MQHTQSRQQGRFAPGWPNGRLCLKHYKCMKKRFWKIEGYDSTEKIYGTQVPVGLFSESRIRELLRVLAGKASLDFDEIVGAYAKRVTKQANVLLEVEKDGLYPKYRCGTNPFFVARVFERENYN